MGFYITGSILFMLGLLCCIKPAKVAFLLYCSWIPLRKIFGIMRTKEEEKMKREEIIKTTKTSTRVGGALMMLLGILILALPILAYLEGIGVI